MSRITCVVQARMSSNRLPGKVLCEIAGMPMLELVIRRLQRSREIGRIIVATSIEAEDDLIEALCFRLGVNCQRGDLKDVRGRFRDALRDDKPEHFVRITADCPLIDPEVVDKAVMAHISEKADYTTNTLRRTYPKGLDVEVIRYESFLKTFSLESTGYDNEHVTPILRRDDEFRQLNIENNTDLSSLRWTVDYLYDLENIRRISARVTDIVAANMRDFLDSSPSC